MSDTWVAIAVLSLMFLAVIVVECSRLHYRGVVQRQWATPVRGSAADEA